MPEDRAQLVLPGVLDQCDQMRKDAFDAKGCGFYLSEGSVKKHCDFPNCRCYPFDTLGYIRRLKLKRGH